ncbi:MAG: beta-ketoacyl-ACP synthase II [Candidatus Caenarcaniphilales bacterium]|nr:beta-ketoacyl-ACP synthase II [Candidatus Caenarcaniphilales bacterium]
MSRRVVITGIGAVSPVGDSLDEIWGNLVNGRTGITQVTVFTPQEYGLDFKAAGEIEDFKISDYYPEAKADSMVKDMDRVTLFCMAASKLAITDSGFDKAIEEGKINPERVTIVVGTGIGGISTTGEDIYKLINHGPKRVGVRSIIRLMPNAPAGQVGIEFGLKGQAKSESTACASGLDAIMDAFYAIKFGLADAAVTGGTEACLMPLAVTSFYNMRALSRRNVDPAEACCPFSSDRDGFVMAEGAAMFTLEEYESAKKRGAKIYGEILGGSGTCDAYHITAPHESGEGASRAMKEAVERSGLNMTDIGYIHAHGTSTPLNDARETFAIKKAFGEHAKNLLVSSTKSMTGHMIGAAGPMGVIASLMAIKTKNVPPTINYKNPDPDCDLNYVPNASQELKSLKYAMIDSLGFGGHNTCLVVSEV